jgi:hypothetical protein
VTSDEQRRRGTPLPDAVVAQTSRLSKSADFIPGWVDKPQSFHKRETLRYLTPETCIGREVTR